VESTDPVTSRRELDFMSLGSSPPASDGVIPALTLTGVLRMQRSRCSVYEEAVG
jgi:hypothetical protein